MSTDLLVLMAIAMVSVAAIAGAAVWAIAWQNKKQAESYCRIIAQADERVQVEIRNTRVFAKMNAALTKAAEYAGYQQMAAMSQEIADGPVPDHSGEPPAAGTNGPANPTPVDAYQTYQSLVDRAHAMNEATASPPYFPEGGP